MYSRTQNENGTFNSKCLYCFMTVATAIEDERALEQVEGQHMCVEKQLLELMRSPRTTTVH